MDRSALQRDFETRMPDMHNIYTAYQARLRQANAMDFDDLLVNTYLLFGIKRYLRKYEERFDFVLVDEYQDTNYAQQCIMMQLTERKAKICVVGDDAQSIYAFRGANIDNILNFQRISLHPGFSNSNAIIAVRSISLERLTVLSNTMNARYRKMCIARMTKEIRFFISRHTVTKKRLSSYVMRYRE